MTEWKQCAWRCKQNSLNWIERNGWVYKCDSWWRRRSERLSSAPHTRHTLNTQRLSRNAIRRGQLSETRLSRCRTLAARLSRCGPGHGRPASWWRLLVCRRGLHGRRRAPGVDGRGRAWIAGDSQTHESWANKGRTWCAWALLRVHRAPGFGRPIRRRERYRSLACLRKASSAVAAAVEFSQRHASYSRYSLFPWNGLSTSIYTLSLAPLLTRCLWCSLYALLC